MTRISIPVTVEEKEAIARSAKQELRTPRDQARYLIRLALGLIDLPPQKITESAAAKFDRTEPVALSNPSTL